MTIVNLVLNNFTTDSRVLKVSNTLQAMGHEVIVVALHENNLAVREVLPNGVKVHRVHLVTRKWCKNHFIQIIKLIEFLFTFIIDYRKSDILHCNDLSGLFVGVICKLTRPGLPLVYDSHEFAINDFPYETKWSITLKFALEWLFIKFAKQVISVSESISHEYSRLYRIPKPHLVLNCPPYHEQPKLNLFRERLGIRSDQTIFLYQGGLSKGRGIELMLEAFSYLDSDQIVLVFMGYGPLEDLIQKQVLKQKAVYYHPAVGFDMLLKFTSSADYGISFIEDSCLSDRYCLPNKIFEYLMAGLPVLISNLFEMKRLVEVERVGVVAAENTVKGFRQAVHASLHQNYAAIQKNVFSARRKYCWEEQEKVLKKVYDVL